MRNSNVLSVLFFCAVILAVHCGVSQAAPCYGPRMPHKKQFFIGGQSFFVLDRDLEKEYGSMRSRQHFFLLSLGLQEWLSLDLKGGGGDITHQSVAGVHTAYPSYLGGGYGLRLRWCDTEKVKGVLGFQHISIHPHTVSVNGQKNKAVLDDWQFSLLASYELPWVRAYAGGRWSRMDYIHWVDTVRNRVKSEGELNLSAVIGIDIPLGKRAWLNLEGQVAGGEAVAASIMIAL